MDYIFETPSAVGNYFFKRPNWPKPHLMMVEETIHGLVGYPTIGERIILKDFERPLDMSFKGPFTDADVVIK